MLRLNRNKISWYVETVESVVYYRNSSVLRVTIGENLIKNLLIFFKTKKSIFFW